MGAASEWAGTWRHVLPALADCGAHVNRHLCRVACVVGCGALPGPRCSGQPQPVQWRQLGRSKHQLSCSRRAGAQDGRESVQPAADSSS